MHFKTLLVTKTGFKLKGVLKWKDIYIEMILDVMYMYIIYIYIAPI